MEVLSRATEGPGSFFPLFFFPCLQYGSAIPNREHFSPLSTFLNTFEGEPRAVLISLLQNTYNNI